MKPLCAFMAAIFLLTAAQRPVQAASTVSVEFFYDALAPYGDWVDVEGYGYCFRPAVTLSDPSWRPYTDGSWIYTDAGWTWDSEEDFGWATYHYGRWLLVGGMWLWVPGDTWGPAWVSWRYNDDYVGWAPLPPEATWQPTIGFSVYVDVSYDIGPAYYCFMPVRHFGDHHLRRWIEPWQRNVYFMRNTENYTRIVHRSSGDRLTAVFNEGPDFERFSRRSESPIRRMQLTEHREVNFRDPKTNLRNLAENDHFRVIAPEVDRNADRKSAPARVAKQIDRGQVRRGWEGYKEDEVRELRSEMQTAARNADQEVKRGASGEPGRAPRALPVTPSAAANAERGKDAKQGSESRTRPDAEELRKAKPINPAAERDERTTLRPGDQDEIRKALPTQRDDDERKRIPKAEPGKIQPPIPGRDFDRKDLDRKTPDRFRIVPQDAPPRSESDNKPGANRPDDNPPGPSKSMKREEERGNSKRPGRDQLPKMKLDEPPAKAAPRIAPPPKAPEEPKIPKEQMRKLEPPKMEQRKIEAPKVIPHHEPPRQAPPPPQNIQRPEGGGKPGGKPQGNKPDDDDDKRKKPH